MPRIGMKAIYILVTCNRGFRRIVGTLGHLVIFIRVRAHNWEFNL